MTAQVNLSNLFDNKPRQWGLRGDPYLWDEMQEHFLNVAFSGSEEEFQSLLEQAYEQLTGHPLNHESSFFIPRYDQGGMSSGHVSPNFWIDTGIPLLLERFKVYNE